MQYHLRHSSGQKTEKAPLRFYKINQAVFTDTLNRNAIENTVKGEQWPVKKCTTNLLQQHSAVNIDRFCDWHAGPYTGNIWQEKFHKLWISPSRNDIGRHKAFTKLGDFLDFEILTPGLWWWYDVFCTGYFNSTLNPVIYAMTNR